jgi:UDP-GlcNAc3NAcA epimerase
MKIITVVGARPQFVKASVVSSALARHSRVSEAIVHTGQHHEMSMSGVFFEELKIPKPVINLGVSGLAHGAMTGRMLEAIELVLHDLRPDLMVVYGDTNSTLAGALAAAKIGVPIVHVEAGLRSFNRRMPEEINRIVTDHLSSVLFAPTEAAVANLKREGIDGWSVRLVGDVMYDAALRFSDEQRLPSAILDSAPGEFALGRVSTTANRAWY